MKIYVQKNLKVRCSDICRRGSRAKRRHDSVLLIIITKLSYLTILLYVAGFLSIVISTAQESGDASSAESNENASSPLQNENISLAEPNENASSAEANENASSAEPNENASSAEPNENAFSAEPNENAFLDLRNENASSAQPNENASSTQESTAVNESTTIHEATTVNESTTIQESTTTQPPKGIAMDAILKKLELEEKDNCRDLLLAIQQELKKSDNEVCSYITQEDAVTTPEANATDNETTNETSEITTETSEETTTEASEETTTETTTEATSEETTTETTTEATTLAAVKKRSNEEKRAEDRADEDDPYKEQETKEKVQSILAVCPMTESKLISEVALAYTTKCNKALPVPKIPGFLHSCSSRISEPSLMVIFVLITLKFLAAWLNQ